METMLRKFVTLLVALLVTTGGFLAFDSGVAYAAPPPALPKAAPDADLKFQPAMDYDKDARQRAFHAPIHRQSLDYLQMDVLRAMSHRLRFAIAPQDFPTVGEKSVMGLRVMPQRDRTTR